MSINRRHNRRNGDNNLEKQDDYNINYEYICRYIESTLKQNTGLLKDMELFAQQNDIPIAKLETIRFIELLILASKATKVLEIGAAIGYSTIAIAMCGVEVTTIEQDTQMVDLLKNNIQKAGLSDVITVLQGDALSILPNIDTTFDFIFLDAAKGQYLGFLPHCMRLLKEGGILFSDNILYKGMVATDELMVRRKVTIVRRLREYLKVLCESESVITSIVPVGDGAALSYKRGDIE